MPGIISLTGPQQLCLRDALLSLYAEESDFAELLLYCDVRLAAISSPQVPLRTKILVAIQDADKKGYLFKLLTRAREETPADPRLAQLANELTPAAPSADVNPFQACLLSGGHILVNRKQLRAALQELLRPEGKRILVVQDEPSLAADTTGHLQTGKSHSLQLISHLRQATSAFEFTRIDLEAESRAVGSGRLVRPYDLAKSITALLGCKHVLTPPPNDGQWARWTRSISCCCLQKRLIS